MKTIWKKQLQAVTVQQIEVPVGAKMLTVDEQYNEITVWFLCDDDVELETRYIIVVGTGINAPFDITENYTYIGSAILLGPPLHDQNTPGQYVFHVFEKKPLRKLA